MYMQTQRDMNIEDFKKNWELPQIMSRLRCCLVSLGVIEDISALSGKQLRNTKTY